MSNFNLAGGNPAATIKDPPPPANKPVTEDGKPSVADGLAALQAEAGVGSTEEMIHFSCQPIARYKIGDYEFQNGYLALPKSEAEAFVEFMKTQPPSEINRIRVLPSAPVSLMAGRPLIQGIDTTANTVDPPSPEQQA